MENCNIQYCIDVNDITSKKLTFLIIDDSHLAFIDFIKLAYFGTLNHTYFNPKNGEYIVFEKGKFYNRYTKEEFNQNFKIIQATETMAII